MCRILNVALDLRGKKRPLDNVFADYAVGEDREEKQIERNDQWTRQTFTAQS